MLFWSIKITIISIILIFLVHHLIFFFKSTLTIPKIKDLVNTSSQKYENMYNIISSTTSSESASSSLIDNTTTNLDLLPTINSSDSLVDKNNLIDTNMKNELKDFFKTQLNSNLEEKSYSIY